MNLQETETVEDAFKFGYFLGYREGGNKYELSPEMLQHIAEFAYLGEMTGGAYLSPDSPAVIFGDEEL